MSRVIAADAWPSIRCTAFTFEILCAGHSIVGGPGAGVDWPSYLRNFLTASIPQNTGIVFTSHAGSPRDAQWDIGAGWARNDTTNDTIYIEATTLVAPARFTSTRAGTIVDIYLLPTSASIRYRIDGSGWTTIVPATGTAVPQKVTVTGLPNTTHVLDIETLSTSPCYLVGAEVRNSYGFSITRMGAGGTMPYQRVAADWKTLGPMSTIADPDLTIIEISTNYMGAPSLRVRTARTWSR